MADKEEVYKEYEKEFRTKAVKAGYSEGHIKHCLQYARPLLEKKLPVIYNTSHLSKLLGYRKTYLKRAVLRTTYFYREFKIFKKQGGVRTIQEPLPSLKEIQQWILKHILYKVPVSRFSKAYIPKKGIKENVKYHKKQPKVLALDIQRFFPSINRVRVEKVFKELGYSAIISALLSKLCCLNEHLPEGAPTSPYLSNIILRGFDKEVADHCNSQTPKIRYTRYADDLTFSGEEFEEEKLIQFVKEVLEKESLKLNGQKTKIMKPNQRQVVTGIIVNNKKIQVPKEKRKKLRQEVYFIQKYGLKDHLRKINCSKENYLEHLLGTAKYILFINPDDQETKKYKKIIEEWIAEETRNMLQRYIDTVNETQQIEEWKSDLVEIKAIAPQGIICLLSTAAYYDLTTFIPSEHYIAIPKSTTIERPEYPPLEVFYWEGEEYTLGQTKVMTEEEEIQIYDIEKTVCDVLKYQKDIGQGISMEVLKNYLRRKDRKIAKLLDYARQLGIFKQLSNVLDTLLI